VGAHDGITFSNTFLFEKKYGWKGLAIEPNPKIFIELENNRNCLIENVAISSKPGKHNFIAIEGHSNMLSGIESNYSKKHLRRLKREIEVYNQKVVKHVMETTTMVNLFDKYDMERVSFISIDTEGSDLEVLKSIDFNKTEIDIIIIENTDQNPTSIKRYLKKFDYHCALKIENEEIYSRRDNFKLLRSIGKRYFQRKSIFRHTVGSFLKYIS
jgi:FkbM family methyltransferase